MNNLTFAGLDGAVVCALLSFSPLSLHLPILRARRYASAVLSYAHVFVCHKSVFCQNIRTDRSGFRHRASFWIVVS